MASIEIDRNDGLSSSSAIKGPCRVATTANIVLSGLQTVDGVVLAVADRVLVKDQADARFNGLYRVDTGGWSRCKDFSRNDDVVKGTRVAVTDGTTNASGTWQVSSSTVNFDTSNLTFAFVERTSPADIAALPAATTLTGAEIVSVVQLGGARRSTTGAILDIPYAQPIGRYGSGDVPASIKEHFRHFANAKTDYGLQLFNNAADTGGGVKDNAAALQAAIDDVQKYGGAIFIPPDERAQSYICGPITTRSGVGYKDRSVGIVGVDIGDGSRQLRNSYNVPPDQFVFGTGLKLKANSGAPLITSVAQSGHLFMKNIQLDGDKSNQSVDTRVVSFEDRNLGADGYGYGGWFDNVLITNSALAGLWVGADRAMGLYRDVWVTHCGADGGEAGWFLGTFDTQIIRPGIGSCPGVGLYIGVTAQLEIYGGAMFLNKTHLEVGANAQSINVAGVHFDGATDYSVKVNNYTGSLRSSHTFAHCMWGRRNNSFVNDTLADIYNDSDALHLIGPVFLGNEDAAAKKSKYCIEFGSNGRSLMVGENYDTTKSYATSFANLPSRVFRQGDMRAALQYNEFYHQLNVRSSVVNDYMGIQAVDGTSVAFFAASQSGGKGGNMRLFDTSGIRQVCIGVDNALGRQRWSSLTSYADQAAAGAAGLVAGDVYVTTATGAITVKT